MKNAEVKEKEPVDKNTLSRLVYSKWLFRVGESLLNRKTAPEICTASIIFDASLEVIFNELVDYYYVKHDAKCFQRPLGKIYYLSTIVKELFAFPGLEPRPSSVVNLNEVIRFHDLRNQIQHRGFIPSPPQILDQYELTKTALKEISEKILEINWQSISLASLIQEEKIKDFYRRAEEYYNKNKFKESALCLVLAFELAKFKQKIDIAGSGISRHRFVGETSKSEEIKKICSYIEKIDEEIEIIKLGLNYKEFRRYDDFAQINILEHFDLIPEEINEKTLQELIQKHEFAFVDNEQLLKDWVNFAVDFVLRSVIQWETLQRLVPALKDLSSLFNLE